MGQPHSPEEKLAKPSDAIRDRATLASVFLGPQAENGDMLLKLITDVLVDYIHWRRNFHPEDPPVITEWIKHTEGFEIPYSKFLQKLYYLLGILKRNDVPFASTRYIGHMVSDQLIPAIVGYFAAMLYNPNNVTTEASPTTTTLEMDFGLELCRIVGYDKDRCWGHLCSGGTVANLEALWVARNLKYLPLATKLVAKNHRLNFDIALDGETVPIQAVSLWRLLNCDIPETLQCFNICIASLQKSRIAGHERQAREMIIDDSISGLGLEEFFNRIKTAFREEIRKEFPQGLSPGVIVVPSTAHYSLMKVAEVLGLGKGATRLRKIPITSKFRLSVPDLREYLKSCLDSKIPVIAVVSFCGSTEEGAIDPIDEVHALRSQLKREGLAFFHHCDAAYGGYVRTLLSGHEVEGDLPGIASRVEHSNPELNATQTPWPVSEVRRAIQAIHETDSVTIDPHKLGYVPYPAGAVVFREKRVRDVIALHPSYLEKPLIGSYILEGSKPGASAAACWLASATLPLDKEGHGILIRRAIRNAYTLADGLRELSARLSEDVRLTVLNYPPDLNIVCFIFNFPRGQADPLCFMNAYMEEVYHQFLKFDSEKALSAHDIIISKTEFSPEEYRPEMLEAFLREVKVEPTNFCPRSSPLWKDSQSDERLFVLRCTVMNPWLGMMVTETQDPGPQKTKVEDLTFIWRFISKLRNYLELVKGYRDELDEMVRQERRGERERPKGARLGRLLLRE